MAEIPFPDRWKFWLLPWAIGLVVAGYPNPALIMYVGLFPWGLMDVVGWQRSGHDSDYIVGWLPYIALTIAALLSRPRVIYFTLYVILCFLLVANAAGCRKMNAEMEGHWRR